MTHPTDLKQLENYLTILDNVLKPFPVSDRAEIVTEIRSHVLSAIEREPGTPVQKILDALGQPETVANRYLLERGLKPTRPSVSPIVKWLVIGVLGMGAIGAVISIFVFTRFSPIVEIDGEKGSVSILGGMVKVNGDTNSVKSSGDFTSESGDTLLIRYLNGEIRLKSTAEKRASWECELGHEVFTPDSAGTGPSPTQNRATHTWTLDFTDFSKTKCSFRIPNGIQVKIDGDNGRIAVYEAQFGVDARLDNGDIQITPDTAQNYRYDLSVNNGKTDSFESSKNDNAYPIKARVKNGRIGKGE